MALKNITDMLMQKKLSQLTLGVLLYIVIVLQIVMISDSPHRGARSDRNQSMDHIFSPQEHISHGKSQMSRLVSNFTPAGHGGGNAHINLDIPLDMTFGMSLNLPDHTELCKRRNIISREPLVVVQVHSACDNKPQRDAIRNTWGNIRYVRRQVFVVFVVGKCRCKDDNRRINREMLLNRDIVQLNITDEYDHLTMKSLSGLSWLLKHCPQSSYMIKCDDDSFLNVKYIMKYLSLLTSNTERIHGFVYRHPRVMRTGLWAVPKEVHTKDYYPDYCSGNNYVIPSSVVSKLLTCHYQHHPTHLHIEDVHITGVLAKCANVTLHHDSRFPSWVSAPSLTNIRALVQGSLFGLHGVDYARMYPLHQMLRNCNDCAFNQSQLHYWFQMIKTTYPVI